MIQRHFTSTAVVLNDRLQVLLVQHKKLQVWLCPGGHIEDDEDPVHAMHREVFEETGLEVEILPAAPFAGIGDGFARELPQPMFVLEEDIGRKGDHFHIDFVYACRALGTQAAFDPLESTGIGWFELDQLEGLEMYDNVRAVIRRAAQLLKERQEAGQK